MYRTFIILLLSCILIQDGLSNPITQFLSNPLMRFGQRESEDATTGDDLVSIAKNECSVCPSSLSSMACERLILSRQRIKDPQNKEQLNLISRELHSSRRSLKTLVKLSKESSKYSKCLEVATKKELTNISPTLKIKSNKNELLTPSENLKILSKSLANILSEKLPAGIEGNIEKGPRPGTPVPSSAPRSFRWASKALYFVTKENKHEWMDSSDYLTALDSDTSQGRPESLALTMKFGKPPTGKEVKKAFKLAVRTNRQLKNVVETRKGSFTVSALSKEEFKITAAFKEDYIYLISHME